MNLIWDSIPNRTYRVQYKGSLSPSEWLELSGDVLAPSGTASQTDTTLGGAVHRFYCVLLLPRDVQ